MIKSKITQIGTSVGIVLSKEVLSKLHAEKGDDVFFIETEDGYKIIAYDPEFEKDMIKAKKILKKYRDVFHMLAKA